MIHNSLNVLNVNLEMLPAFLILMIFMIKLRNLMKILLYIFLIKRIFFTLHSNTFTTKPRYRHTHKYKRRSKTKHFILESRTERTVTPLVREIIQLQEHYVFSHSVQHYTRACMPRSKMWLSTQFDFETAEAHYPQPNFAHIHPLVSVNVR